MQEAVDYRKIEATDGMGGWQEHGAKALADALCVNTRLTSLDMSANGIGKEVSEPLPLTP